MKRNSMMPPHHGLRVAHVITGLNTGGAETNLYRLLETLRPPTFEHVVISLGMEGALSARIARSAKLHHLGMHAGWVRPSELWRLRGLIKGYQPDVIHGWMDHANLIAAVAAWRLPVPIIWGVRRSLYEIRREKRTTRLVIRAAACLSRRPARIVYNSAVSKAQYTASGYSAARALVIPNGIDVEAFKPDCTARMGVRSELGIDSEALAIGLVARVHPMKDHSNFLRAAAHFVVNYPRAVFVLVGDGTVADNHELGELIDQLRLREYVKLCGRRVDIAAVNNALDIACSASFWGEAFPNTIAEAMACGTPCVATDLSDIREIIGDTGFIVPTQDPLALSSAWAKLATLGRQGLRTLGASARARVVERYTLAAVAHRYAALYTAVTE
ncbi:MAG: glycosyltransferase [Gammaproteobacteria bacterium]